MENLLGIGDFAVLCGLSPKMLRNYAAAGMLVPALIDQASGHRYYSTRQLADARVVALLRQAGIPVAEIAVFLRDPQVEALDRWEREMAAQWSARRHALARAREALVGQRRPPRSLPGAHIEGASVDYTIRSGTATDRGERDTNEDRALVAERLWAVADGIGGLPGGEVASHLALESLGAAFEDDPTTAGLAAACREANRSVWERACGRPDGAMGTTLTAVALTADAGPVVAHVGDSRLYRLGADLELVTADHTVVAEMVRAGHLREEEASYHPHRNVLTRAVGVAPEMEAEIFPLACSLGDRLLLCTDGVSGVLSTETLRSALAAPDDPRRAAAEVVALAVRNGATDNATALVLHLCS